MYPISRFDLRETRLADGTSDLQLVIQGELDRDEQTTHDVIIEAFDGGLPPNTGSMTVRLSAQGIAQRLELTVDTVVVLEEDHSQVNHPLLTVTVTEDGDPQNIQLVYAVSEATGTDHGHLFDIDADTGEVYLNSLLDYEQRHHYVLTVTVYDAGRNPDTADAQIRVQVQDINDHAPQIRLTSSSREVAVPENSVPDAVVTTLIVTDQDSDENGDVTCTVSHVTPSVNCNGNGCHNGFQIRHQNGNEYVLRTVLTYDREEHDHYDVLVRCEDRGHDALTSELLLTVSITDVNDNDPIFENHTYEVYIQENDVPTEAILEVSATDADIGEHADISYQITGTSAEKFHIANSGAITVLEPLDYELASTIHLSLVVRDGPSSAARSSTASLQIRVQDVNDNAPLFTQSRYVLYGPEDMATGITVSAVNDCQRRSLIVY